jgi:hypothetical protein
MSRPALALVVFTLLAVVHTWPLATNPAHLSRNDNADTVLNEWTLAWVNHQIVHDPRHLFDANIFYPERYTLAYSEAMFVQSVLAAPVLAAGGSPVLAYNLVLLAGFALTGFAFWWLVLRWTDSTAAAYVSGSLAAFNAHVLVRLPHLQAQHAEFIALSLFFLDRAFVSKRLRDAAWLGVVFALDAMTSVYMLVFCTWALACASFARVRDGLRDPVRSVRAALLAASVAAALLAPYLAGYYAFHHLTGFERQADEATAFAGWWPDYLLTDARLHHALWSYRFDALAHADAFPGVTAIALTVLALAWPGTRRDPRVRMCAAAAVGCAAISMVPKAPFYPRLHDAFVLFRIARTPARLAQIVLLMVAVIAGFGVAGLARRWSQRSGWSFLAVALVVAVNVEALRAPLDYVPFDRISPAYDALAAIPGAVIVEIPLFPPSSMFLNAEYMLNSTRHWHPMLNGHSGLRPDSYDETYRLVASFPSPASLVALHARGVTHVVVHFDRVSEAERSAVEQSQALVRVASDGAINVYRLR